MREPLTHVVRQATDELALTAINEVTRHPEPAIFPPGTIRRTKSSQKNSSSQIDYFNLVVACEHSESIELLGLLRKSEGTELRRMEYQPDVILYFGWVAQLIEIDRPTPGKPRDDARLFYAIQLAFVFLSTCETFESKFMDEIAKYARSNHGDYPPEGNSVASMRRARLIAQFISEVTDFDVVTPTGTDRHFFHKFEEASGFIARRERIRRLAELLRDIVVDTVEERRQQREHRVSICLLILTAFLLVSVVSDVIGAIDFAKRGQLLWDIRAGIVILLPAAAIGLIWRLLPGWRDGSA